ncbi:terminase gpA endonuclease subunit [Hydrocarboniphaga sp.]|uniref:terminase gpA endonuclease subunit n=1 Tax=Hydrocarboniphaga sp. TaxID=2033016 RepID=UPI003D13146C
MGDFFVLPALTALLLQLSDLARSAWQQTRLLFAPAERLTCVEWSETYREVAGGFKQGKFSFYDQPVFKAIVRAYDDPAVEEVCCQKPTQIGWTAGVVLNVLGFHIHQDPCAIVAVFAQEKSVKKFVAEKLDPTIKRTKVLAERVPIESRNAENTIFHKGFPLGYIALGGANSPANIKSTDARVGIVEEPDDVSKDVKNQGDAIALTKARTKGSPNRKHLIGGSPTLDEASNIAEEMLKSDQRRLYVACWHCEHLQTLRWSQVKWRDDADQHHPVYGRARPETARYHCEACADETTGKGLWTDAQKETAIREACAAEEAEPGSRWKAHAPFSGIAGFYLNELYSVFATARMEALVRTRLVAELADSRGDDGKMKEFVNGTEGEVYRRKNSEMPDLDTLKQRQEPENYAEWTVPADGLVAELAVDVQRGGATSGESRLEYRARVWGRDRESWLTSVGILVGNVLEEPVWEQLDRTIQTPIKNLGGGTVYIGAVSIDAGDGMTADAVLAYIRSRKRKFPNVKFSPVKGAPESARMREVYTPPSPSVDVAANDKASKYGLRLYIVGTGRAKDWIFVHLKLGADRGRGRMHTYAGVPEIYWEHMTSEVLVPGKGGRMVYKRRAGKANHWLDCEVYGLHGSLRLRVHTMSAAEWAMTEALVRQRNLDLAPVLADPDPAIAPPALFPVAEPPTAEPVDANNFLLELQKLRRKNARA